MDNCRPGRALGAGLIGASGVWCLAFGVWLAWAGQGRVGLVVDAYASYVYVRGLKFDRSGAPGNGDVICRHATIYCYGRRGEGAATCTAYKKAAARLSFVSAYNMKPAAVSYRQLICHSCHALSRRLTLDAVGRGYGPTFRALEAYLDIGFAVYPQ